MTTERLRSKVARHVRDKGLALSLEIRSSIAEAMGRDIDEAINELELEGYLDRCYGGRLCLVRPYPGDIRFLEASQWESTVLEAAESASGGLGHGSKEHAFEFRWGRECVGECIDAGWLRLAPGKRHGEGRIHITRHGRAALHRWRRKKR